MPSKRKETERVTFFIPKDVKGQLDNFVAMNYSIADAYGAYSNVISNAVSSYCVSSTDSIPVNYLMEDKGQKTPDYKNTIGPLHDKWLEELAKKNV